MPKVKALVRGGGMWPDAPAHAHYSSDLTLAAKRLAESVIDDLARAGVRVTLDKLGKAHFSSGRTPSRDARLAIERHGDLIESFLRAKGP